jgi:hypothetical protein
MRAALHKCGLCVFPAPTPAAADRARRADDAALRLALDEMRREGQSGGKGARRLAEASRQQGGLNVTSRASSRMTGKGVPPTTTGSRSTLDSPPSNRPLGVKEDAFAQSKVEGGSTSTNQPIPPHHRALSTVQPSTVFVAADSLELKQRLHDLHDRKAAGGEPSVVAVVLLMVGQYFVLWCSLFIFSY